MYDEENIKEKTFTEGVENSKQELDSENNTYNPLKSC